MRYDLREIRLNGLTEAIAFAKEQGGEVEAGQVRHTLSVDIREDGKTIAVALCLETKPGQFAIRLAMGKETDDEALGQIATDTILHKMQAAGVCVSRIQTENDNLTDRLWAQANWLDRIPDDEAPSEAQDESDAPSDEVADEASPQAA